MKRYTDDERPLPPLSHAQCYDCGLRYDSPAWCDVAVPDSVWEIINPTYHPGAGLLCFNCIAARCDEAGLYDVPVRIRSGPFEVSHEEI